MYDKFFLLIICVLVTGQVFGQKVPADSTDSKEGIAIGELGAASSMETRSKKKSYGYSLAVEATPIENWLEVELGISPTRSAYHKELAIDFLLKKPWTISPRLEFMLGIGPQWSHTKDSGITANLWSGELALDFMYWPFRKRAVGFFIEPDYVHSFREQDQSIEFSGGLLISIP